MTSGNHASGTDRIAEVASSMNYDIIVNVQGDEPLIQPEMIDDVISVLDDPRASIGTLAIRIKDQRGIFDPNVVKVVFNRNGFAFYFSRAPIPYHRDEWKDLDHLTIHNSHLTVFKHIGIYSYRKDVLAQLSKLPQSPLEIIEKLEQLRALEHGFTIKVKETVHDTLGVDTPEDLERIEKCLNSSL
jgi:3-deoxy-manno-octulosonate cytidylyltransferase (CMP-KDO synthetase)